MNIEDRLKAIICNQFDVDGHILHSGTVFESDLGADSLDLIELVMAVESEFDIDLPDNEKIWHIATLRDATRLVSECMNAQGKAA